MEKPRKTEKINHKEPNLKFAVVTYLELDYLGLDSGLVRCIKVINWLDHPIALMLPNSFFSPRLSWSWDMCIPVLVVYLESVETSL